MIIPASYLLYFVLLFLPIVTEADVNGELLTEVALNTTAFNPSQGDQVGLTYTLTRPDSVTIHIYDPDNGLVRTLLDAKPQQPGRHEVAWDGRDMEGHLVPDEAYTFTIETASGAVYDPTTFSGGVVGDITKARFQQDGTVIYKLSAPARVLIRLGIRDGPLLKTLVHWKPRVVGTITEYWDGRDEDGFIRLQDHKDFTALITYVTLPEATVITYGNDQENYRDYKLRRAEGRPQKPDRPRRSDPEIRLRPKHLVPSAWTRPPQIYLTFPEQDQGKGNAVPEVNDTVLVRIDADPAGRDLLLRDQFEILFFVDNVFFTEAERGYLPFNWRWELQKIPAGEHIITVNISSLKGHIGVASRKVRVIRGTDQ